MVFSHDEQPLLFLPQYIRERAPKESWRAIQMANVEIFYCGPALGIPDAIMSAFVDVGVSIGGHSREEAEAHVQSIRKSEDRFHLEQF